MRSEYKFNQAWSDTVAISMVDIYANILTAIKPG